MIQINRQTSKGSDRDCQSVRVRERAPCFHVECQLEVLGFSNFCAFPSFIFLHFFFVFLSNVLFVSSYIFKSFLFLSVILHIFTLSINLLSSISFIRFFLISFVFQLLFSIVAYFPFSLHSSFTSLREKEQQKARETLQETKTQKKIKAQKNSEREEQRKNKKNDTTRDQR